MRGSELLDKMELVDPELVSDADKPVKKNNAWIKWTAAACACIAICVVTVPRFTKHETPALPQEDAAPKIAGDTDTETETPQEEALIAEPAPSLNIPMDTNMQMDTTKPMIEKYDCDEEMEYAIPENGKVIRSIPLLKAIDAYGENAGYRVIVGLFKDENPLPGNGEDVKLESERLYSGGYVTAIETGRYPAGETVTYFTLHATAEQIRNFASSDDYGYFLSLYGEFVPISDVEIETYNNGNMTIDVGLKNPNEEITLEEALRDKKFGNFVINASLSDYPEQYFERTSYGISEFLINDSEEIHWDLWEYTEDMAERFVSVSDTTKYDLSLYPPPRADSVPDELRQVVNDPIFDCGEMTFDAVKLRAEINDEGTTSMRFSVRCGDVVIAVSTKGVSTERLYDIIEPLRGQH